MAKRNPAENQLNNYRNENYVGPWFQFIFSLNQILLKRFKCCFTLNHYMEELKLYQIPRINLVIKLGIGL